MFCQLIIQCLLTGFYCYTLRTHDDINDWISFFSLIFDSYLRKTYISKLVHTTGFFNNFHQALEG
jgi:hypothetical protein